MSTARLSSKSQLVVPAEVRRKLGLKPGDEVIVEVEGDRAVLRKAEASPLEALLAFGREHGHVLQGFEGELDKARDEWDE
jgi:antitoxin PrlF